MKIYKFLTKKISAIFLIFLSYLVAPFILLSIRSKSKNSNVRLNFLLIPQLTRIGDVVCTTSVFRELKGKYPNSHIAVLVSVMVAPILKNNPYINEIIIFEEYSFWGLNHKIKKDNFDWCFSFSGTSLSTMIAFWGMIPKRIKITRQNRPISEFLTDWISTSRVMYKDHAYLPQVYLNMLRLAGIDSQNTSKEVYTNRDSDLKVEKFFSMNKVLPTDLVIGVSITAGNSIKEWGDDKYAELTKKIVETYGVKIIFIGSRRDDLRISSLISKLDVANKTSFIKATSFSLGDLPSLIKRFNYFISGDTGPMHIANALGVPLINIIGPVDPREQAPSDEKSILVFPKTRIEPTIFAFDKAGPKELSRQTLERTTVEDVSLAFEDLYRNQH